MYEVLCKPLLFSLDPESAHQVMKFFARAVNNPILAKLLGRVYAHDDARLAVTLAGITFKNPIGLAAGFDKDADLIGVCTALGFGHLELGTVTARAQPGNPRPRIFRFPGDRALINRMGFPSAGADEVRRRLLAHRKLFKGLPPLGINIGKSKEVDLEQAVGDYLYSFNALAEVADYVAVNVSSPNTQGLRQLQDRERLSLILSGLQAANTRALPIFVKVAPDLTWSALEELVDCALQHRVAGLIATNTTITREGLSVSTEEAGGLSGSPLRQRSLEVVRFLGSRLQGKGMALIGVGGVASAQDVLEMLSAGASLVQIYTGLIYGGPKMVQGILRELSAFMDRTGSLTLADAGLAWENCKKVA